MHTFPRKRIAAVVMSSALAVIATCSSMVAMAETVKLDGVNEVPPVTTTATGIVTVNGQPISTGVKTITNAQFASKFGLFEF